MASLEPPGGETVSETVHICPHGQSLQDRRKSLELNRIEAEKELELIRQKYKNKKGIGFKRNHRLTLKYRSSWGMRSEFLMWYNI